MSAKVSKRRNSNEFHSDTKTLIHSVTAAQRLEAPGDHLKHRAGYKQKKVPPADFQDLLR